MCENGYLWCYNGIRGEWLWQYIAQINYKIGINNNKQVELVIPKIYLSGNSQYISFIYHINDSKMLLEIYDILGRLVYKDILARAGESIFTYPWNADNSLNTQLSNGIYLYLIKSNAENKLTMGKIVYLK